MRAVMNFFLICIISFTLPACVSIPIERLSLDQDAKQFKLEPNAAVIYIYRNQFIGGANTAQIIFDEKVLGKTRNGHFLKIITKPGLHVIGSQTQQTVYLELKAKAGQVYYIWQNLRFMDERAYLKLVDENVGKIGVAECQLIQHLQPE